jgi:hypothetical protein
MRFLVMDACVGDMYRQASAQLMRKVQVAPPCCSLLCYGALMAAELVMPLLLLLLLQVMPASHIPLLYLINSLLQTFLTAPLSKISGSSIQASVQALQ